MAVTALPGGAKTVRPEADTRPLRTRNGHVSLCALCASSCPLCPLLRAARVTSSADWYNTPGLFGFLAGRIGAQDVAVQVVFNPSYCRRARGRRDEQVGFGQRRAGPHLLDRLLIRPAPWCRWHWPGCDAESRWWRRTRRNAPCRCGTPALRFRPGPPITVERLL